MHGGRRGSRTRGMVAMVAVAVVAAAVSGVAVRWADRRSDGEPVATSGPTTTAKVSRRTLQLTDETTATLTFVSSATVTAPTAGTVTKLLAEGEVAAAGTVVAMVDGTPLVALYGDLPSYRDLSSSSSDGPDVYQLELNLVALGFDPDGEISIDESYDSATTAAVERWQESLGIDATGDVPQSLVAYIPGKVLIDDVTATVGGGIAAGGTLATGRLVERNLAVPSIPDGGTVSGVATAGTAVATGTVLFADGGYPVVAIEGDAAVLPRLDRDLELGVSAGEDVKLLEQMLAQLGFNDGGALTVDDTFDSSTERALSAWYASLGLTPADAGKFPDGGFVVVPSGLEVGATIVADGTDPGRETPVLSLTAPARVVTTTAPLGDDTFAVGASVTVEYPDGTTAPGTVTSVGTVATNSTGQPGGQATVPITIEVDQVPDSVAGFVEIPVTLQVVTKAIENAFVVPTSALVALSEGGYALEVVDGPETTHLIPVETGSFADGFVEVTGADLADGLDVVVPS